MCANASNTSTLQVTAIHVVCTAAFYKTQTK